MKEKEIEELDEMGEKRKGRPLSVNIKKLECRKGKDYAEIIFFGDLHFGHPTCLLEKAKQMLDYCLKKKIYVILMGDMIECGITGSVGDSVYTQSLNPQGQIEEVIELLKPLAEKNLILGFHSGNHEERIFKNTGVDVAKIMAGILNVPYLSRACWHILRLGSQRYTVYSLHGSSGSRFIYTKLKVATDISHYFDADIIAHAHVHDLATSIIERQKINQDWNVSSRKTYIVLTGHYLGYQLSYAQAKGMPPSKTGSPKIKIYANRKDIHIST